MLLVYAENHRVLKIACELGLAVAVPMELLEEARKGGLSLWRPKCILLKRCLEKALTQAATIARRP